MDSKSKDLAILQPTNIFTVSAYEGRLLMTFEPNSMLKRIAAKKMAEDLRATLKTDPAYANGVFDEIENYTDYFSLFCVTFNGCEWHPKGDEQPGLVWLADKLQKWGDMTQMERWAVRMEADISQWEVIISGFLDQRVTSIPIESRPAELLTDEERVQALSPKVISSNDDGDSSANS